jgi:hypothetical protein
MQCQIMKLKKKTNSMTRIKSTRGPKKREEKHVQIHIELCLSLYCFPNIIIF